MVRWRFYVITCAARSGFDSKDETVSVWRTISEPDRMPCLALVAQWIERLPPKRKVVGPIPAEGTNTYKAFSGSWLFGSY